MTECKHIPVLDYVNDDWVAVWQRPLKCAHCERLLNGNSSYSKGSGWTYVWWEAIECR